MFQIRLGRQLGHAMLRELAAQEAVELLAKFQAVALEHRVLSRRAAEIEQTDRAGALAEMFHGEHQFSAGFSIDSGDAADQIAPVAPGLEAERAMRGIEREILR